MKFEKVRAYKIANSPKTVNERVFMISGFLLPVWTSMDTADSRVFREKLDDSEDLLGRIVSPKVDGAN